MGAAVNARRFACTSCSHVEWIETGKDSEICPNCGSEMKERYGH